MRSSGSLMATMPLATGDLFLKDHHAFFALSLSIPCIVFLAMKPTDEIMKKTFSLRRSISWKFRRSLLRGGGNITGTRDNYGDGEEEKSSGNASSSGENRNNNRCTHSRNDEARNTNGLLLTEINDEDRNSVKINSKRKRAEEGGFTTLIRKISLTSSQSVHEINTTNSNAASNNTEISSRELVSTTNRCKRSKHNKVEGITSEEEEEEETLDANNYVGKSLSLRSSSMKPSFSPPSCRGDSKKREISLLDTAAQNLDNTGYSYFQLGEYQEALASYSEGLRMKNKSLELLSPSKSNDDDNDTSTRYLMDRLLAGIDTSFHNIDYLFQLQQSISSFPTGSGDDVLPSILCGDAMKVYKKSLHLMKQILGEKHLTVGRALRTTGSIYFRNNNNNDNDDEVLEFYEEALTILIDNLGYHHLDVATVYSDIGDVYVSTQRIELAIQNYKESLTICWPQLGSNHSKVIMLLEKISTIEMTNMSHQTLQKRKKVIDNDDIIMINNNDNKNNSNNNNKKKKKRKYYDNFIIDDLRELNKDIQGDISFVDELSRELTSDIIGNSSTLVSDDDNSNDSDVDNYSDDLSYAEEDNNNNNWDEQLSFLEDDDDDYYYNISSNHNTKISPPEPMMMRSPTSVITKKYRS